MNMQDVFTETFNFIYFQGPAITNNSCVYRKKLEDGKVLKCAAGYWLKDEDYREELEGKYASVLVKEGYLPEVEGVSSQNDFWADLQSAHDEAAELSSGGVQFRLDYVLNMEDFAAKYKLEFTPPKTD